MSLIYPEEAWARFGPKVAVYDATGLKLNRVMACDPLTGEVIKVMQDTDPSAKWVGIYCLLLRWLRKRWGILVHGDIMAVHYFAPAPLRLTADVADAQTQQRVA